MSHIRKKGKFYYVYYRVPDDGKPRRAGGRKPRKASPAKPASPFRLIGKKLDATTKAAAEKEKRKYDDLERVARLVLKTRAQEAQVVTEEDYGGLAFDDQGRYVGTVQEVEDDEARQAREHEEAMNPKIEVFWEQFKEWANDPMGGDRSPNTVIAYAVAWKRMTGSLKPKRLKDVTPAAVQRLIKLWQADGMADSGIKQYCNALQGIYSSAAKMGVFSEPNPFKLPWKSKRQDSEAPPYFLQTNEFQKLLEEAKKKNEVTYLFTALCGHAGLRKDEAANVRWEQIDFERKTIILKAHKADENKGIEEFRLKSKRVRSIPLKKELAEILEPYKKKSGYVLPIQNGSRIRFWVPKSFREACVAAGVPECHPHSLRHTFASLALISGVSIAKIQQWLGHTSLSTTQVYTHLNAHDADIDRF